MVVRRQPAAVVLGDHRAFGDRDQRVMRVEVVARRGRRPRWWRPAADRAGRRDRSSPPRARGHSRPAARARHRAGRRTGPSAPAAALRRARGWSLFSARADRPARPAGQADDAVGKSVEDLQRQMHGRAGRRFEIGAADQPDQIARSRPRWRQSAPAGKAPVPAAARSRASLPRARRKREVELAADDRLDAFLDRLLRKFQRAEQIVGVGDGDRRRRILGGVRRRPSTAAARLRAANRPNARADG